MTRRIGGVMDYSRLMPAAETPATAVECARRMHSAGHGLHDIASALRVHPELVRRWVVAFENGEAAAVHARAWKAGTSEL